MADQLAGQQSIDPADKVDQATNQEVLQKLSSQWEKQWQNEHSQALRKARQKGWLIREENSDGTLIQLMRLGQNGMPVYYTTNNEDAAKTIATNQVWPGGWLNIGLNGFNEKVGEWDGGEVLSTHQEFGNRVIQRDNPSATSEHATHVAGTLIAQGVEAASKGMAFKADLDAYDWLSDDSEMADAATGGLLLSNHSYGRITGFREADTAWLWYGDTDVSQDEDYSFGFYNASAGRWDEIAHNAPYYLIVKSAGNDRNDDGPSSSETHYVRNDQFEWVESSKERDTDGNYDCLPPKSTAKNILTVGAVKDMPSGYGQPSDVDMVSFSSWGPTDDGRIKPDIVANGRSLYSTSDGSNTDYKRKSGTSMAAPSVTGSLLLLQSYYKQTHSGTPLKAATLKALSIHTADEAGPGKGPDYQFGWGLMNTAAAAQLIARDTASNNLQEITLQNNNPTSLKVTANGQEPLVATICWTDEPGNSPAPALDPTDKMLVNDLDLRILDSIQKAYKPWRLDPANPANQATRGDNKRDNLEQVLIKNPVPGATYTITIDHKGNLSQGEAQEVGLILSGLNDASTSVTCQDTTRINANYGYVSDGSGTDTYGNNADCYWEITAPNGEPLHLDFTKFKTVNPGDTLLVYSAHSTKNPPIAKLTGDQVPGTINSGSSKLMLHFKTDATFNNDGWAFQFGSYEAGACWGLNFMNYIASSDAKTAYIWQLLDSDAQIPQSRFKLSEAGQAFTDWQDQEGQSIATDFPMRLDSFSVGVTHENNSGLKDTFEVYVQALETGRFPSGPVLWKGLHTTDQSLSPGGDYNAPQNSIKRLTFKPGILINGSFFIGLRYKGSQMDSAGIVGHFENVSSGQGAEATKADKGQAYRKYPAIGDQWQPAADGTDPLYIDRDNDNTYDSGANEAPFFQVARITAMVSQVADRPAKPVISKEGERLVVKGDYANYQWFRDGSLLNGEKDSVIQLTQEGNYQVYVFERYRGCGRQSDAFKYEKSSGIADHAGNAVELFPNPTPGRLLLAVKNPQQVQRVRVLSSKGKVIREAIPVKKAQNFIRIDEQPGGVYFLEITKSNGIERMKFIKQ